jgi:hypothetical protein
MTTQQALIEQWRAKAKEARDVAEIGHRNGERDAVVGFSYAATAFEKCADQLEAVLASLSPGECRTAEQDKD